MILSFAFFIGLAYVAVKIGINTKEMAPLPGSIAGAFILAGFPEELAKLLLILLSIRIFRRHKQIPAKRK